MIEYPLSCHSFPGVQKPLDEYGSSSTSVGGAAPAKDSGDDEDDFDLFGSEDEEEVCWP